MGKRWQLMGMALALSMLFGCGHPQISTLVVYEEPETAKAATAISFPVIMPDSTLVAEKFSSYSGPYWEDGSGALVENVAGLMLYNPTNRMISFAAYCVEQAGEQLYFFVYRLPPMSRCLVLESDRKSYSSRQIEACRELCIRWEHQELSRDQIDYVCLGPRMTVVNRDARQLRHVTVRYKRYVKAGDYYLGGAAFSAHLFYLLPEERRSVLPEHYDAAHARIVGIDVET